VLERTTFVSAPRHLANALNLDSTERSYRSLVVGARKFGEVLRAYAPAVVFEVNPEVAALAEEMKRQTRSAQQTDV
jgi:hypothetical protein